MAFTVHMCPFLYTCWLCSQDLDKAVSVLLIKTGDSNKFIRETAEKSLVAMVENVSAHRALAALINAGTRLVIQYWFQ